MRVRWTTDAADDLERICDYMAESRPESARRVAQSVVERIGTFWKRSPTSDALVAFRVRESGLPSAPVRRNLRSSRRTDNRPANSARSAAMALRVWCRPSTV